MHPSFNIRSGNNNASQQQLFVQAGKQGIALFTLDPQSNTCSDIVSWHFDEQLNGSSLTDQLQEILSEEELLNRTYNKTDVIYSFTESILTPPELYSEINRHEMLDTVFGDVNNNSVQTDFMYRQNLHNVYRIPVDFHNIVSRRFSNANFTHQYSLLPSALKGELSAVFYPNSFTVLLCSGNKLQLLQSFNYTVPEDAAYHLLNVCRHFDVAVNEVALKLYGMVDRDSALYTTLYKYFMNIGFALLPDVFHYPEALSDFPAHYFSHLFATASCV